MDFIYTVEVSEPDDIPCVCDACDWHGLSGEVAELDHTMLTPGNPSPMGRCPNPACDGFLVYPDTADDRTRAAAPALLAALKEVTRCLAWHEERHGVAMDRKAVEDARSAIAKAEVR